MSWLPVTTLASGFELRLPVHVITGAQPGPTLGITAGIHGDEYLPIEAIRRVVEQLDPAQLSGTVLAIPVVNPLAIEAQTRHTPIDMQNLNRVFPGARPAAEEDQQRQRLARRIASQWRLACQMIVRDEDILVEY